MQILLLPLIFVFIVVSPLIYAFIKAKKGTLKPKKFIKVNALSFIIGMTLFAVMFPLGAYAAADTASATGDLSSAIKAIAAGLSVGLGSLGTGIAVKGAASAAIGAISENEKMLGKAILFVALAEGVAIYGLLIAILILYT